MNTILWCKVRMVY